MADRSQLMRARGARRGCPQKCVDVDPSGGFAVLKDINGIAQYLLIPTARVGGIESPDLLTPGSPNYWRAAWEARRFVEAKLGSGASPRRALARHQLD
jgi:CDP-diacylglycerol pyrophosphatase